jgi:NitT/TauT family transport system substrate-binding protein
MKKLFHSLVVCAFVVTAMTFLNLEVAGAQVKGVTFAMDWMINGSHAPYFVAVEKGFYKDADLKVEIVRGYGTGDTIKKVASKNAAFGVADFAGLVGSVVRENTPVKAVAAVYGKAMLGLLYLKESGIKSPKDMEGRKIARSASGASVLMFPAFIKANNLDRSKITEVVVDATSFLPMLLSRQVDAVLEQSVHQGRFQKAAEEGGQKVTVMAMLYSDFGLETYGNVILVQNDLIEKDPPLVKTFVQASLKGLAYSFDHPDEAISILAKTNPQVTQERAIEELIAVKATWSASLLKTGMGFMTPERTGGSVDNIVNALGLEKPKSLELVYNNRFVR